MLQAQGHSVVGHRSLGTRRILERLAHKYYPHLARLFTPEDMASI